MEILLKEGVVLFLKTGDIVEGTVIDKQGTRMFVDLGAKGTGIVYGREYYAASDLIRHMKIGDAISAKVVELDNTEGYTELSLREAGEEQRWSSLKKLMEDGAFFDLPVLEANRGGIILELKGVKGFLPASQLSAKNYPRIEGGDKEKIYQELQKLIGVTLHVKIIGVNPHENKLIFTEKTPELTENAEIHPVHYTIGQEVEGEITNIVDFGAFMRFSSSGPEGLIHISEIDWTLIEHPRDVLRIGEKVRAKVIDVQGDKVSFSLKRLKEDPWEHASKSFRKGDTIRGEITRFNPFGAFVLVDVPHIPSAQEESAPQTHINETNTPPEEERRETPDDTKTDKTHSKKVQGLVHISEFVTEANMKGMVEIGKSYDFKILLIDPKEHRLSLGLLRRET